MSGFDDLHQQFTAKVRAMATDATAADPAPLPAPRSSKWRQHPLLVAAVTLGVTATAAGAVALATQQSAPLNGQLPPSVAPDDHSPTGYRFAVRPQLAIGAVGWCTITTFTGSGPGRYGGGTSCGRARRSDEPILDSGFISMLDRLDDPGSERRFADAVVDHTITAARRADGVIVTPRAGRQLPRGWKSILVAERGSGGLTYLGQDGRPIHQLTDTEHGARNFPIQHYSDVSATELAARKWCSLRAIPGSGVRIGRVHTLTSSPKATPNLNGRPFLSCTTATVTYDRVPYSAVILVDAGRPGRSPDPLPGAIRDPDGTVRLQPTVATPAASARRTEGSWLLVQGGTEQGRPDVLRALAAADPARSPH